MFVLATLMTLINQVSGTPYISGGDSPAGTDCSGLASWVANAATGRPIYGDRFNTGNQEAALLARGFKYGTAPNALVIGWNSGHTAVTLPDGTPVSSGEGGTGVSIGGGGAYQPQFTHHMYLPMPAAQVPADPAAPGGPTIVNVSHTAPAPPPAAVPPPPGAPLPPPPGAPLPPPPAPGMLPPPPAALPPAPDAPPAGVPGAPPPVNPQAPPAPAAI